MKKLFVSTLVILLIIQIVRFLLDPVIASLPPYRSKTFYTSGGFQDYTDYAKYTYFLPVTERMLENNGYFEKVAEENIAEILAHIDDFSGWVRICGGELLENYDFVPSAIEEGDYFYIKSKYGQPIGQSSAYEKFDHYTLYYFDIESQILYCFHNNI